MQRGMNQLSKWAAGGVLLALLLGVGMRFVWPDDIEYKQDEIYSFTRTRNFLAGNAADPGASPWLGISLTMTLTLVLMA